MCACSDDGSRYRHSEHPRIFEIIRGLGTLVSRHGETGFLFCTYYLFFGGSFPVYLLHWLRNFPLPLNTHSYLYYIIQTRPSVIWVDSVLPSVSLLRVRK